MKIRQLTLIVLTLNMLLLSSSNTLVMPFLPLYLQDELNCPQSYLSIYIATAYSITFIISMFAAPIWGNLAFGVKGVESFSFKENTDRMGECKKLPDIADAVHHIPGKT